MNSRILLLTTIVSVILILAGDSFAKPVKHRVKRQLAGIPRQFQNVDVLGYLRNERAVRFQLKCLIYDGPCDTIGKYLKRYIPIWLRTQCKNCDDETKAQAGKLITFFQENYPKEWDDAIAKYGKGSFTEEEVARFETELGVKINRDPNAPVATGPSKIDTKALEKLAKETLNILKTTKAPIVLAVGNTTTVVNVPQAAVDKVLSEGHKGPVKLSEFISTKVDDKKQVDSEISKQEETKEVEKSVEGNAVSRSDSGVSVKIGINSEDTLVKTADEQIHTEEQNSKIENTSNLKEMEVLPKIPPNEKEISPENDSKFKVNMGNEDKIDMSIVKMEDATMTPVGNSGSSEDVVEEMQTTPEPLICMTKQMINDYKDKAIVKP